MAAESSPICSICAERAVYLDRETRAHLCGIHLKESVEARVLSKILTAGDLPKTIGIAFSGGKDSTALLAALVTLKDRIPAQVICM